MADRRRQIIQLLGSRYDQLWFPSARWKGASRGEAPAQWVACERCSGKGEYERFKRMVACETCSHLCVDCEGTGFDVRRDAPCKTCRTTGDVSLGRVWAKGHKGEVHTDTYTGEKVGSAASSASSKPRKRVACDACSGEGATAKGRCERCSGSGKRDLHVFDLSVDTGGEGDLDALTASIARRDEAGSYHELDLALAGILHHANKPLRYVALTVHATQAVRLLDEVFLPPATRTLDRLSEFEQALVELALAYLDSRMPDPIRVPRDVRLNEREVQRVVKGAALNGLDRRRRDAQIRRWEREGKPRPWIGQQTGLGDRQLREIINGRTEAA